MLSNLKWGAINLQGLKLVRESGQFHEAYFIGHKLTSRCISGLSVDNAGTNEKKTLCTTSNPKKQKNDIVKFGVEWSRIRVLCNPSWYREVRLGLWKVTCGGRWGEVEDEGRWKVTSGGRWGELECVREKALEPSFSITSGCEGEKCSNLRVVVFSITSSSGCEWNAGGGISYSMGMLRLCGWNI